MKIKVQIERSDLCRFNGFDMIGPERETLRGRM